MRYLSPLLCLSAALLPMDAADWPGWRGPNATAVSDETNLPVRWSTDENIAWKIDLSGRGASSPIVVQDRVYMTSQTEEAEFKVLALDRPSGRLVWVKQIGRGKLPSNRIHNMATPTPASDGNHVWTLFGTGDLTCLDKDGNALWHRNLVSEYGPYKLNHGYGSSPVLSNGRLFIACMHQGPSYLLAVDAISGKNVWKKDLNPEPKDEAQDSYSTPLLLQVDGRTQIALAGAEAIDAYEPDTGARLWSLGGLKVPHSFGRTIAGPTAGEDVVLTVASGFQNQGYTVALKPGAAKDQRKASRLWTSRKFSPDCPTPLIYSGKVFLIRDDGMASALDLATGEPFWQERLFTENVKVSPVAGDGKVYFLSGQGNCVVVDATSKTLKVLATNEFKESTLSTPAISRGQLFIRTDARLYAIKR